MIDLDDLLLMDPQATFNKCIVGIVERFNDRFVVYDRACVLATLAEEMEPEDGEDRDDLALEFYSFNVLGAWLGPGTPGFGTPWAPET